MLFNKCKYLIIQRDIYGNVNKLCIVLNREVNTTIFGYCMSIDNGYCHCFKKYINDIIKEEKILCTK